MALGDIYKRSRDVVYRQIDGESILVPIRNNVGDLDSIYNLNEVGAFVWNELDGEKRLNEIKDRILQEFDVSAEQAEEDLLGFIAQLRDIRVIEATA